MLTLTDRALVPSGGIDESNGDGKYILWPKDVDAVADRIWQFLRDMYKISACGVIITDSHSSPLRWGTTGFGLSYCGFQPLTDYVGTPDLFGRPYQFQKRSVLDGISGGAVVVMGE